MKINQMSDGERETYARFVNETKPELKKHRYKVIILSTVVSLVVLGTIILYWIKPDLTYSTALLIGGQLYALWGALLLARGALSSPPTLGLMSMTRWDGNSRLFAELMKARRNAKVGIYFIVGGFLIQALVMLGIVSVFLSMLGFGS